MKPGEGVALGARYRLVSRIAVGGMGEVWVAHDESLARDVAVKVLREEFAGDEGFLERFRTEARNCAQLSHPNIAQLYDYGEQDGSAFLVMELILGEPLSDLLDREPVLPTRRLLPILAETARALHAAHVAGVVHRDVKPGNILLSRTGRVKITDFGISTATGRIPMTDSGMVMGTAQYLSPEQAIGKAATPASDIYSLGIVAYEALAGNRPFTGPTAVDIAVAHVNTPVPPLPPDVDPELAALVMRMLAKDPEERPRSAASLARVLDEIAVRTPSTGIPTVLGRHARPVDVVDAVSTGGVQLDTFPRLVPTQPRPTGEPARLVPGRDEPVGETPPHTPPAFPAGTVPSPSAPGTGSTPGTAGVPTPPSGERAASATPADAPAPDAVATPPARTRRRARAADPATGAAPSGVTRALDAVRSGLRAAARWVTQPVPAGATKGRRWWHMSRPVIVLVLVVLFALLGAAFADTLWGRSRSAPPPDEAGPQILVLASHAPDVPRGIIEDSPDTTTARDQ